MDQAVQSRVSNRILCSDTRLLFLAEWIRWFGTRLGSRNHWVAIRCRSSVATLHCMHAERMAGHVVGVSEEQERGEGRVVGSKSR